jgi:hypothetical protein
VFDAGGYRGAYNSAYVGTATALAGSLWLMFGGFYVVRSAIARDEQTGVGQVLAATPLTRIQYLVGKFASNLMVLASMAGVLAVTAGALQVARGEHNAINPGALLLPFVLLTLPVLLLTAAAAVLFETIPLLRAGVGNITWFCVWMILAIAGGGAPLGGLGVVAESMRRAMAAAGIRQPAEFSVGFTEVDRPLDVFTWAGLHPTGGFIANRAILIVVAVGLAALPSVWFHRFDPARGRPRRATVRTRDEATAPPVGASGQVDPPLPRPIRAVTLSPLPAAGARSTRGPGPLIAGELRVLVQGDSLWWWLVVAAINIAALVVPAGLIDPPGATTAVMLSAAWIWPILIWSRLGAQRRANGTETLLSAYPGTYRQLAAEWAAGITLTALCGLGPVLRMITTTDTTAANAWLGATLLIPSLALGLGVLSGSSLPFQALYVLLWYAAANQVTAANYMGTVFTNDQHADTLPLLTTGLALAVLAMTFGIRSLRHAAR